jgi:hypothetical protein
MANNIIEIEPLQVYTPLGMKSVNILKVCSFSGYDFNGGSGRCEIAIGEIINEDFRPYVTDSVEIPSEVIQNWGADDLPIFEYILSQKQLKRKKIGFFERLFS